MIYTDKDGDQWRFSASRNRMEVALTGTGASPEDAEWSGLGFTPGNEPLNEMRAIEYNRSIPMAEIIRQCKENPEE